jgi:hypothetical protein
VTQLMAMKVEPMDEENIDEEAIAGVQLTASAKRFVVFVANIFHEQICRGKSGKTTTLVLDCVAEYARGLGETALNEAKEEDAKAKVVSSFGKS